MLIETTRHSSAINGSILADMLGHASDNGILIKFQKPIINYDTTLNLTSLASSQHHSQ